MLLHPEDLKAIEEIVHKAVKKEMAEAIPKNEKPAKKEKQA
jgi:hypothetical protein